MPEEDSECVFFKTFYIQTLVFYLSLHATVDGGSNPTNQSWIVEWANLNMGMLDVLPSIPYHPWDWYIYLHENHILPLKTTIQVGKYTSPMDGKGIAYSLKT